MLYCRAEDKPVPRTELVKGFEYDRDRYVLVEDHQLRRLAPPSSRVMEVREFVPAAELDPVYVDAFYYVALQDGGEKPCALLFEALRRSAYVALAQWTLQHREHLVVLRPGRFACSPTPCFTARKCARPRSSAPTPDSFPARSWSWRNCW